MSEQRRWLVVCTYNRMRSPAFAALLSQALQEAGCGGDITVESAGVRGEEGCSCDVFYRLYVYKGS